MTRKPQSRSGTVQKSHRNRYLLLTVVMIVALLYAYIVKTHMQPPPDPGNSGPSLADISSGEAAMQQITDQIEHIQEMLERDSTNFAAWAALGNLYFDANIPEEAIAHYRRALTLKPADLTVLTDLATMYRAIDRPDSAVALLEHVVALDSTWQQGWFNLGVIYNFDFKDQRRALAAWRRFLALNPASEQSTAVLQEIERIEAGLGK